MKHLPCLSAFVRMLAMGILLTLGSHAQAQTDSLPPEARIATFDQGGTLWVEHPIYPQVTYCLDRVAAVVKAKPELASVEPFKTVLSGNRKAIAKLSKQDLEKILVARLTGMPVDEFKAQVKAWLETATDPRWGRHYTELTYQPMQELMKYLRAGGLCREAACCTQENPPRSRSGNSRPAGLQEMRGRRPCQ
jgi:hypothetical protein